MTHFRNFYSFILNVYFFFLFFFFLNHVRLPLSSIIIERNTSIIIPVYHLQLQLRFEVKNFRRAKQQSVNYFHCIPPLTTTFTHLLLYIVYAKNKQRSLLVGNMYESVNV